MKVFLSSKTFISLSIFLLAILLIGQNLNKPFWGEHDWNGVRYGNIAKNYLRYGVFNLKFAQIENSGPIGDKLEYFTHYPPILPILIFLSYKIFGISEFSTRIIPLLATAGSILLIFLIGSKLWNLKTGILASFFSLTLPLTLYFGKTPVHEPIVVFFVLLTFLAYLSKRKILFILFSIVAHLITWAGFFLIPAIITVSLIRRDKFDIKRNYPYLLIPIVIFVGYLILVYFQTGSLVGGDLVGVFLQRSSISQEIQPSGFNLISYISRVRLWFFILYSPLLSILVVTWVLFLIRGRLNDSDWQLLILGIFGIIYLIIFPNAVFIHNYLVFYLLPFFTLASSRVVWICSEFVIFKKIRFVIPLVILLAILFETKPYLDALNKSQEDRLAVLIGKAINQQTRFEDIILVSPAKYQYSADKFLRFYGDRKFVYSDSEDISHQVTVLVDQEGEKFEIIKK